MNDHPVSSRIELNACLSRLLMGREHVNSSLHVLTGYSFCINLTIETSTDSVNVPLILCHAMIKCK